MSRGRIKAKQTKVARNLKYNQTPMDLDALREELAHTKPHLDSEHVEDEEEQTAE